MSASPARNHESSLEDEIEELSPEDFIETNEVPLETRAEWQKQESVEESLDDFSETLSVAYEMRKDMKKRPGETPGEDMILADRETGLTGVFDGLGGEGSGDKASATAAYVMPEIYKQQAAEMAYNADITKYRDEFFAGQKNLEHPALHDFADQKMKQMWGNLPDKVQRTLLALYTTAKGVNGEVVKTGGLTTMTVGKTVEMPDGRAYEITASIGDSGAIKLREDGSVSELTVEDSSLSDAVAAGFISPEEAKNPDHVVKMHGKEVTDPKTGKPLTVKLLRRGMSQALGQKGIEPHMTVNLVREGESVVYMSDGLRDEILGDDGFFDPEKAASVMAPNSSPLEKAKALNTEASKGTKGDEKSIVVKERLHTLSNEDLLEDVA